MGFRDLFDPEYDDWAESDAMSAAPDFDEDEPAEPYYPGDSNPLWEKEDDPRAR